MPGKNLFFKWNFNGNLMGPAVPATWEAKGGESLESQVSRIA
jgi:hypothetical protein